MKNKILTLSFLFLTPLLYSQVIEMPSIEVQPIYKGVYKIAFAETESYPPHRMEKVAGYNYQIKMDITFKKSISNIISNYGIVCKLPENKIEKILFSSESLIPLSNRHYKYSFPIRIKEKGWMNIFITERKNFSRDLNVYFYKNKSNMESYYLGAW